MNEKLNNTAECSEESALGAEWNNLGDGMDWGAHLERARELNDQIIEDTSSDTDTEEDIDDYTFSVMRNYHELANYRKNERFESMVKQEKIEREFNDALTSVDELEGYAESEDPRVIRDIVHYYDKEISVYRLRGFPMKFLGHMINYRENDRGWEKGRELSDRLMENPALWNKYSPADIVVSEKGWGGGGNGLANTLSTSYVDLATGIDSYDHLPKVSNLIVPTGRVVYGISKVRPTSIIFARHQDGRTSPQSNISSGTPFYDGVSSIDELNADNATNRMYNEVAMLRYDDNGNIVPVDFMVTDDGGILQATEGLPERDDYYGQHTRAHYENAIKRHAVEHNVPIVLIEREYYPQSAKDYARNLGKLLEIMGPEELFDKMPEESRNQILQEFLNGENLDAWECIKNSDAREKLSKLVDFSGDVGVKDVFDVFLELNGY